MKKHSRRQFALIALTIPVKMLRLVVLRTGSIWRLQQCTLAAGIMTSEVIGAFSPSIGTFSSWPVH